MLNSTHLDDGHHFHCCGKQGTCTSRYTTARYAAKCCKVQAVDLRDGTITVYSEEAELEAQAADTARWEAELKAAKYECSCGERFNKVEHARSCRKCRRYLGHSCQEVYDLDEKKVVWVRS